MFKEIPDLLTPEEIAELRAIAARAPFVDGKISNPHSRVKNNLQLHDAALSQQASRIVAKAMYSHDDFLAFAFPVNIAPPLVTRYQPGMTYGAHADAAFLQIGQTSLRSDLSATVFLNDPEAYGGGALRITLGTRELAFKGPAGSAIVYPSNMLHHVEPVQSGERLVAITFIQSRIADATNRMALYELNDITAMEGRKMDWENFTRLQLVQQHLLRLWGETS